MQCEPNHTFFSFTQIKTNFTCCSITTDSCMFIQIAVSFLTRKCLIYFKCSIRADSKDRERRGTKSTRRRSRSRSPEKPKPDDSGLGFDPNNLDKVCIKTCIV